MAFRLSVSLATTYEGCPRRAFYEHIADRRDVPRRSAAPLEGGIHVHAHIAQLYRKPKEPRPFYFRTLKSALGAWRDRLRRALADARATGLLDEKECAAAKRYYAIGAECITNYWNANYGKPHPREIEKRYRIPLWSAIDLVGRMDQVRNVSLEYIRRHRPELTESGRLREGYDPVVIVDIKTSYSDYDVDAFRANPTLLERLRGQYELHESMQPTAYTFLYTQAHGRRPVGFVWYHLRSGKAFFTYREDGDILAMFDRLRHVLDNIAALSFPKNVGYRCAKCPYLIPCNEDRPLRYAHPEGIPEDAGEDLSATPTYRETELPYRVRREPTQLRLRLTLPRRPKRPLPPLAAVRSVEELLIPSLPWHGADPLTADADHEPLE